MKKVVLMTYWIIIYAIISFSIFYFAVVLQEYQAHVYDEYVIHGNTAVFRCQVPDFMKEFLTVTSWTRDDGLVIVHHKNAGKVLRFFYIYAHYNSVHL